MPLANQVLGLLVFLALLLFCQMEHIAAEALLDDAFSGTIAVAVVLDSKQGRLLW
jgi:hypothetical protein